MPVASGKLRHKVQLQQPVNVQDPNTGEVVPVWTTIAEPWADVHPISGREFVAAGAEQSEVRGRFEIRFREEIDATMRFVHRGKYYGILAVLPDAESGREHLNCMVSEGVRLDQ